MMPKLLSEVYRPLPGGREPAATPERPRSKHDRKRVTLRSAVLLPAPAAGAADPALRPATE